MFKNRGAITTTAGISIGLLSIMVIGFASWTTKIINTNQDKIQNVRIEMSAISTKIEEIDRRTARIEDKVDKIIIQNAQNAKR